MKTYFPKGIWCQAFLRLFLAAGLLVTLISIPQRTVQAAAVHYAKPDGALLGTCNSWVNACILRVALNVAVAGDAIWVKAGTSGTDRSVTFQLKNGVGIFGGFAGTETKPSQRDPLANVTILSGNIGVPNHSTDNSYHVVTGSGTDASAVLDGFTITGGYADGTHQELGGGMFNNTGSPTLTRIIFSSNHAETGGGMYNIQSNPELTNVSFSNNSATRDGGGMHNRNSNPSLSNVTFNSNTSSNLGGGMYSEDSNPSVNNTTFSNNNAGDGGGMVTVNSSPTLSSVTFSSNSATYYGGGLYAINNSNPVMNNVTFTSNSAGNGGGMFVGSSSPTLSNVTFTNNSALSGGGMYNVSSGNPILTNATFAGNSAVGNGGGVRNSGSSPTINNAYFNNNTASFGGGMDNDTSSPTLSNVTFNSNSAANAGGGMNNWENSSPVLINVTFSGNSAVAGGGGGISNNSANPDIKNSILWGNTATIDPQINNISSSTPVITYSDIQGGYAGEGNINADPLLGILGTYGGSTQVFPLLPGSAAIDSGSNVTCASTDQRGISRPQGSHCDMGAFESRGFTLSISAGDNQSTEINSAFAQPLTVSISSSYAEPVDGGSIRFSVPPSGASAVLSASPATVAAGAASLTAMSNGSPGTYQVTAYAAGAALPAIFHFTNTLPPGSACIYLPLIFK
jgi:predicted outer membrane repeat protein